MRAQDAHHLGKLEIIRDANAAFERRDVVRIIEAEGRDTSEGADRLAAIARAQRLAAILDERQPAPRTDRHDRVHVARIAIDGNDHHAARLGADRALDFVRIDVERRRIDVDDDGHQAALDERPHGGRPRERRHDHLVAWPQAARSLGIGDRGDRQKIGGRARIHHDGIRPAVFLPELVLEIAHLGAHRHLRRQQAFERGVDLVGAECRLVQADDRRALVEGEVVIGAAIGGDAVAHPLQELFARHGRTGLEGRIQKGPLNSAISFASAATGRQSSRPLTSA